MSKVETHNFTFDFNFENERVFDSLKAGYGYTRRTHNSRLTVGKTDKGHLLFSARRVLPTEQHAIAPSEGWHHIRGSVYERQTVVTNKDGALGWVLDVMGHLASTPEIPDFLVWEEPKTWYQRLWHWITT